MVRRRNRVSRFFLPLSRAHALILLTVCAALVLGSFSRWKTVSRGDERAEAGSNEDEADARLERAARAALAAEDGTIIVMDARNGRVRAVVNPQAAFGESYAPGSAIKPFTALAALRLNLIDGRARQLCRTRYAYKDLAVSCPHQKTEVAFNLTQALAYSCNYFFGKVGERLDTDAFDATLTSFGFGARTGVNATAEAAGSLPQGEWRVSNAIGLGQQLTVTPVQLITAYTALVNGGHLFVPRQAKAGDFLPEERARLVIAPEHRALLVEGMRGTVRYGTAADANLAALPFEVFGKTGTSAAVHDYRSQGWFVGFAADGDSAGPESVRLAVLVFLKRGSGSEAARAARTVFAEYAKGRGDAEDEKRAREGRAQQPASVSNAPVRIHLTGQNTTRDVSLEEYVLGVVTAEGSVEDELEALKALAVVARAYALHNLHRHAQEGFDFCDTTHCQRYRFAITDERNHARFKNLFRRAVTETEGLTLRDETGQIADAYFHAACGGMTADIETLWGASEAPNYLRGVSDEDCATQSPHPWVDVIPAEKLVKALQSDSRSDTGARLDSITVNSRDRTGRVESLTLLGEERRVVTGWDFKMIVGRVLGWNVIKSSSFEVVRTGSNFVFRGRGFGHGLGLCQEGAHALARRGDTFRQILNHYFPGASVRM